MSPKKLRTRGFKNLLLPVIPDVETPAAWGLARAIGGQVNLVGLLSVPTGDPISAVATKASVFRSSTLKKVVRFSGARKCLCLLVMIS